MSKRFDVTIGEGALRYQRRQQQIAEEQLLDGIYVVRTSAPAARLSAADAVRDYKSLARVERAFRCLKGVDLLVRPIYLRTAAHVRAHIFLCLVAYYVEWHMRQALAPLLYADEELEVLRRTRDPVLPAVGSPDCAQPAPHAINVKMPGPPVAVTTHWCCETAAIR